MTRLAVLALCGLCGLATAAPDRAEQLFKKGKKLLAEKKYADACYAFEQSDRIDPQIGAKLNVARCYEEWGKLATAWRWYSDAEQLATRAGDERAAKIHERLAELDGKVPRLKLTLPPDAITDRVVLRIDGVELALTAIGGDRRVDPGPHQIDTIVAGEKRGKTVAIARGDKVEFPLPVPVRAKPRRAPDPVAAETDPGRTRRLVGLGVSGAGVVAAGVAGFVTLNARSDYQHALHGYCADATDMCDATGLDRTHSAKHRANIATAVAIGGLAAVAGGLIVYFTAPGAPHDRAEHAIYLGPALGGDGAGVVLGGAF